MIKQKFKQTEIGELPEDWEIVPLDKLATPLMGQSPSSQHVSPEKSANSLPFYQGNSEFEGKYLGVPKAYCSKPTRIAEANNVLISVRAPVGAVSLTKEMVSIGRGLAALSCTSCNPDFLFYYLLANEPRWGRIKQGSTFESVNKKEIHDFLIGTPKLVEQDRIASVLSCVDSAIQQTDEVIDNARVLKKGLMQELLTRGIGHTRFKKTELGKTPNDWDVSTIGDLYYTQLGKSLSPLARNGKNQKPYLRNVNVQWGKLDLKSINTMSFEEKELETYKLIPGDLLVCEGGEIGRTAIWAGEISECYFQNAIHRLRPKIDKAIPVYFMHYMKYAILKGTHLGSSNKSTIAHLPSGALKKIKMLVPPKQEQEKIAVILSSVDAKIDCEIEKRDRLEKLKKGLMQDLLTGRVRFPEFLS